MALDAVGAWLWDKYGKDIAGTLAGKAKEQWARFEWNASAEKYRQRMKDLYSTTRMLGKPDPVSLEGIFTDVYLLDRLTAWQRFGIEELRTRHVESGSFVDDAEHISALQLASQQDRLFILGKPGAGKTTFLKYLTLQAATGKLDRVPVFISLNEWAGSGLELLPFIQRQFEICAFPDAAAFIQHLLERGAALICFDGLDEVNAADDKRAAVTQAMCDFTNQYPANKHLITCRIAATDYIFEKFTYVEMADFTPEQVEVFARKWFARDEVKAQRFVDELKRPEHRGLRELAQTPLLLTLLCLNFEETLTFPARRAELYEEALDALLKKWDASRNIKRDEVYRSLSEVYRGLSLGRKRQLLARVAYEYFEEHGQIFFPQSDLAQRIGAFLKSLPGTEAADEPDGEAVLKAVEAQHGIFVERAHTVYSFSHLILQEYFTARYIVDHAFDGALERMIHQHLTDDRWREVFVLTASMLPPEAADAFFAAFQRALDDGLPSDERLLAYTRWAADKAGDYVYLGHPAAARAAARAMTVMTSYRALNLARALDLAHALDLARALNCELVRDFDHTRDLDLALDHTLGYARDLDRALAIDRDLDLDLDLAFIFAWLFARRKYREGARRLMASLAQSSRHAGQSEFVQALSDLFLPAKEASEAEWQAYAASLQALLIRYRNIGHIWNFTDRQWRQLDQYERGTVFLAECLKLAAVSDRKAIENRLLLPPEG
jgi:hypothetical protein